MTQRKNYFVAKAMQSKYAAMSILIVLLVSVVTAFNLYLLASFFLETDATLTQQYTVVSFLSEFTSKYAGRLFTILIVNIFIVFIVAVIYSHKTAGPAYKLEKCIQRITNGDLNFAINLRKDDNLKELASALNKLSEKLRNTLSTAKALTDDMALKAEILDKDQKFTGLLESARELDKLLSQFKFEEEEDDEPTNTSSLEEKEEAEEE